MNVMIADDWLPEPTIEFFEDERGKDESAYIRLREAKFARAVQPNPSYAVFFYLGFDNLPIGIRLLQPLPGVAGTRIVSILLMTDPEIPVERVDGIIHRVREANSRLAPAS